jgi:phosphatidylinositol alpha-1,6-mannosyltransferase
VFAGRPVSRQLLVTDKFAPHAGGTAVVWTEWCRHWPAQSLHVVTRRFPGWREFDCRQRYSVSRVPFLDVPKLRMPLLWFRLLARTAAECRRQHPEVLHCGQILETGMGAPWLKRKYGVPYLLHTYGEELSIYCRRPRLRGHLCRILAEASGVTTISAYSAGLLRRMAGYEGPVLLVHPGVDTERFAPGDGNGIRRRLDLGGGPLMVTVSRLMRRKGHDRVLEALPRIRERFPALRYAIAGTGPDEPRLRRLVREQRLEECVTFLGRVTAEDLVSLMQAADLFVHPNRDLENGDVEGFGIVFLEASACGTPVIGGNSGGAPDAIRDGVNGFLVEPNDVGQLADRVIFLLEDAALRERMGAAGREWAMQFRWDTAAARVWDLSVQAAASARVRR